MPRAVETERSVALATLIVSSLDVVPPFVRGSGFVRHPAELQVEFREDETRTSTGTATELSGIVAG